MARAPLKITAERKKHRKSTDIPLTQEVLAAQEKKEKLKQYAQQIQQTHKPKYSLKKASEMAEIRKQVDNKNLPTR